MSSDSLQAQVFDPAWPPGTVQLEDVPQEGQTTEIILQPTPSHDPNDPLNWPTWRKHLNFGLVCYYVVMVFAIIDVATVTWGPLNEELGFSFELLNDSFAAGCGALCIGGVFLIPFALKYGRRPVYVFSTVAQIAFCAWQAKMYTVADLMATNVLSPLVGALAEVLVQMTVADIYFVHQRGLMNSIYVWFMTIGASLSPLPAGYIVTSQGWRWVWWWMVILMGAGLVAFVFLYEESKYAPTLEGVAPALTPAETNPTPKGEDKKAPSDPEIAAEVAQKDYETPMSQATQATHWIDPSIPAKPYWRKLALWSVSPGSFASMARHSFEPFILLFTIPGIFFMSVAYGAMTAAVTVPVTTLSSVMTQPPYNFDAAQIGLMGLPSFIGTSLAVIISGPLSDWLALHLAKRNGGVFEPEMRLWVSIAFLPFVPAGLFMFGIGLNNGASWPVVAVGLGIAAFGTTPPNSVALTYLTDAYTDIIADSLIGVTFVRNLISTVFVFALAPWVASVGLSGFYITFGLILTVILAANLIFIYFGKKFRYMTAKRYRYYAERQIDLRS
ncbi:major facilitator superfamily domain-containing protein [Aspergillus bertholletiae]|uniref:Major facilitator superfamily domain-containing protein n=1 Tax=Aspergillus bertholletiae TaxID=1226010 RepID=A0A5N7B0Y2_9EURO|nr:major facilitator superfamily domain-containing protein [Aspergillus bertholletiae]